MDEIVQTSVGRPKDLAKRQKILDSAKQLFLTHGYHGSSMNEIAEQAGVSKLTVYNHFQDKATLFTCSIEHSCDSLLLAHALHLDAQSNFKAACQQLCLISLNVVYLPEALKLEHLLLSLAADQNPLAIQFYRASHGKMHDMWRAFFQQAIQLKFLKNEPIDTYIALISSLLFGYRHHQVLLGIQAIPSAAQQTQIIHQALTIFLTQYAVL